MLCNSVLPQSSSIQIQFLFHYYSPLGLVKPPYSIQTAGSFFCDFFILLSIQGSVSMRCWKIADLSLLCYRCSCVKGCAFMVIAAAKRVHGNSFATMDYWIFNRYNYLSALIVYLKRFMCLVEYYETKFCTYYVLAWVVTCAFPKCCACKLLSSLLDRVKKSLAPFTPSIPFFLN